MRTQDMLMVRFTIRATITNIVYTGLYIKLINEPMVNGLWWVGYLRGPGYNFVLLKAIHSAVYVCVWVKTERLHSRTSGRCQPPKARSSSSATARHSRSSLKLAMTWTPSGKPSLPRPNGTAVAGKPSTFTMPV